MADDRIIALLDGSGYHAANQAFLNHWSSDHKELLDFIRENAPTPTDAVRTESDSGTSEYMVLSIGAGNGRRDIDALVVLEDMLPESTVIEYTAVEPCHEQMDALKKRFESRASAVVKGGKNSRSRLAAAETTSAEQFNFEQEKYDLILFTHSLYHMPGSEKEVVSKAMWALKPNTGRIMAALSTEQGGIFQMMGSFWQTIDYSRFEKGSGGLFGQESLVKLLEEDGFQGCLLKLTKLPDVHIDVSICFNDDENSGEEGQHLLNFILQSDTDKLPNEVHEHVMEELKAKAPLTPDGRHRLPHGSGIFLLTGGKKWP